MEARSGGARRVALLALVQLLELDLSVNRLDAAAIDLLSQTDALPKLGKLRLLQNKQRLREQAARLEKAPLELKKLKVDGEAAQIGSERQARESLGELERRHARARARVGRRQRRYARARRRVTCRGTELFGEASPPSRHRQSPAT